MIDVPFLTEAQIEAKADALLAAFSRDREPILGPPVPLEDKLLYYLGLRLHMDDLHARFGVPRIAGRTDILAALWIEDREIRVDESLDPEVNPEAEGRYYFSIGHEVGHWELHRHHILATSAEPHLLMQSSSPVVCRNRDLNGGGSRKERNGTRQQRDARARMELQANRFGACLLMPGFLIQARGSRGSTISILCSWRIARASHLSCGYCCLVPFPATRYQQAPLRTVPLRRSSPTSPESFAPLDARCGFACTSLV